MYLVIHYRVLRNGLRLPRIVNVSSHIIFHLNNCRLFYREWKSIFNGDTVYKNNKKSKTSCWIFHIFYGSAFLPTYFRMKEVFYSPEWWQWERERNNFSQRFLDYIRKISSTESIFLKSPNTSSCYDIEGACRSSSLQ